MELGIVKIQESAEMEIDAARAFVLIQVKSEKVAFGNAALSASNEIKSIVEKIKQADDSIEFDTESISTESGKGLMGKNSSAIYTIKLTVHKLEMLGRILGICSEGKNISVRSVRWDYDEDEPKLALIKEAMKKAKTKANEMMSVVDYEVVGIRSVSDSYHLPQPRDLMLNMAAPMTASMKRSKPAEVDIGTEFKSKKKISAMCHVEFLIKEKANSEG